MPIAARIKAHFDGATRVTAERHGLGRGIVYFAEPLALLAAKRRYPTGWVDDFFIYLSFKLEPDSNLPS